MSDAIAILDGGTLTSVQDAAGRRGFERYGVPSSGACDPGSARLANLLVANDPGAALLEATASGPTIRFDLGTPRGVAIAGAELGGMLDGLPLPAGHARLARPGSILRFTGRRAGLRAYLAVSGGLEIEPVLGSFATDLRSAFGGHLGRGIEAGDRLPLRPLVSASELRRAIRPPAERADRVLRVLPGPHAAGFAPAGVAQLAAASWSVTDASDRAGLRLAGEPIRHGGAGPEVASVGLPMGAIQVPPDGQPIVMLADRPVTGGYAVIATVIRADIGCAAQLAPGDPVRFREVAHAEALTALREEGMRFTEIEPLEPLELDHDPSGLAGWLPPG